MSNILENSPLYDDLPMREVKDEKLAWVFKTSLPPSAWKELSDDRDAAGNQTSTQAYRDKRPALDISL